MADRYQQDKIELKVDGALGKFKPQGFLETCGVGEDSIDVIKLEISDLIDIIAEMTAQKEERRVRKALDVLLGG
ncbi:hypothetical protein ES703_116325 [subsurface metagenome]